MHGGIEEVFPRVFVQGGVPFYCRHVHIKTANIDTIHARSAGKYFTAELFRRFLFRFNAQLLHFNQCLTASSDFRKPMKS